MDAGLPAHIDADGIYSDGDVRLLLGLTAAALARARRAGSLRYSRQGNSLLYRGIWLTEWLECDASCKVQELVGSAVAALRSGDRKRAEECLSALRTEHGISLMLGSELESGQVSDD